MNFLSKPIRKILKNIDKTIINTYTKAGYPLLPITKHLREPLRWYYHQSPWLRHDNQLYWKPFLLNRIHSLLIVEHPQDFLVYGDRIKLRSFGSLMSSQAYYVGEIEFHLVQYVVSQIRPNFVMLDVGGHHGIYSAIVAYELKQRGWPGTIHCFEPDPQNFALLSHNIRENGLSDYVILHNQAVADTIGKQKFLCSSDNSGNFLIEGSEEYVDDGKIPTQEVEVTTLDTWYDQLSHVDFIKMDIQGGEPLALKGAAKIIREYQPNLVVEAVPGWSSTAKTTKILEEYGYFIYGVTKEGKTCDLGSNEVFVSWDWVALPK
jgi:FkbM family methyltransferase